MSRTNDNNRSIIYDNKENRTFTNGLNNIIVNTGTKRVDFCVGYFNLRGWNLIIDQIDQLEGDFVEEENGSMFRKCRLLIGMQRAPEELTRMFYNNKSQFQLDSENVRIQKVQIARDFRKQLLLGLPNKNDEGTLRRLSQQLKDGKVCVKLHLRYPLHAKLYIAYRPGDSMNPIQVLMGSSNLTLAGLCRNGELNAEFANRSDTWAFADWFDEHWDDRFSIDITNELIDAIDNSWAGEKTISPYYIYLKTAYHLSQEAREGVSEFTIPIEFRRELFDFQQNAVLIATKYLRNEKRRGAMIGDVVGLGKTITACAIAKIYENTFASSTLVVCPANLQEMWKKYARKYDLKVDIISMARPIDVDNSRFYRLIIIDESHNLRNGAKGSRYRNIKNLIDRQDSNVLLLSATPYNKDFSDISNQLKLFISEDADLGLRPENYIQKLGGEHQFLHKHSDTYIRSIAASDRGECVVDWNELMKLFRVRRPRTFIKTNYAKTDPKDGRKYLQFPNGDKSYFPDRIPKALKFPSESGDQFSRLYSQEMIEMMESLSLPRYGLAAYINEEKAKTATSLEKQIMENLSRAGGQQRGFCKSTFFKRIDSSGFSFLLTLMRHILRNAVFIYALDNNLKLPISDENQLPDDFIDDQDPTTGMAGSGESSTEDVLNIPTDMAEYMKRAEEYYNQLILKSNVAFIESKYFKRTLKQQLKKDSEILIEMIRLCGDWNPSADQKLNMLEDLISNVHKEDKIVVFTQYSDTARYIYRQLKKRKIGRIAVVTGDSENPTAEVEKFSPLSNDRTDIPAEDQYRVMIATDVLSEGQNLQDSHIVVNFDLPWAIIRLIQRAGRVDRIGQRKDKIYCYSFFPADGVEEIISLRKRLNARINENANMIGSDEFFFEGNEQNLRDMYNEKSGALDEEDDSDVDLASQAYQIWKNATDANPRLKEIIPNLQNMVYSTKQVGNPGETGVITFTRTYNDYDVLTWFSPEGQVVSNSQKRILQAMACAADTPEIPPLENHHELVCKAVEDVQTASYVASTAGMLGNRLSTRFKIVELLEHFYNHPADLFFQEEDRVDLKLAINDIYNYPLLDSAKISLGQMLRKRIDNYEIVKYVLDLRNSGSLCRIPQEENINRDPVIVCSLGMRFTP